jgi:hypothetical protein
MNYGFRRLLRTSRVLAEMGHAEDTLGALAELQRWRNVHSEYSRWLAEFPQVAMVLANMEAVAKGEALCASRPPRKFGPWGVDGLRYMLRNQSSSATAGQS